MDFTTQKLMMGSAAAGGDYWIVTIGDAGTQSGRGIDLDSSGNIYVVGNTTNSGSTNQELHLVKLNPFGLVEWQTSYSASVTENAYDLAVSTGSNRIYCVGSTNSYAAGGAGINILTLAYNLSGVLQWQRVFGGNSTEESRSCAVNSSGSIYVTGNTGSQGAGNFDTYFYAYSSVGNVVFQRSLGGTTAENGLGICLDASDNFYITGYTGSNPVTSTSILVTKYNSSRVIQWQRSLGPGNWSDVGNSIAVDSLSNVYVVGSSQSIPASTLSAAFVIKLSANGNSILWQKSLNGSGDDIATSSIALSDGGVIVLGYTTSSGKTGSTDGFVARYDSIGNLIYQKFLGIVGGSIVFNNAVIDTTETSIYVAATVSGIGNGGDEMAVIKIPVDENAINTTGTIVYKNGTLTPGTPSLTLTTTTLTDQARTLSNTAPTFTTATNNLPTTRTLL